MVELWRDARCVAIDGLVKTFSTANGPKTAVDGLGLAMVEGQITALLGHNGAGKTTTINMLCGLEKPSAGVAKVFGLDVATQRTDIRNQLGVCPQHDILWPDVTVFEHLRLFAVIKGVAAAEVNGQCDKFIQEVGLTEKRDVYASALSGGMRRKLSLALALIGDSRIVVLDEPTSGMDPYSRRFTWDVIQKHREGRIVVLTTHFMDEADLLGDRIAIMAEGQLKCVGSSLFLKQHYGVGYVMTMEKRSNLGAAGEDAIAALVTKVHRGRNGTMRVPRVSLPTRPAYQVLAFESKLTVCALCPCALAPLYPCTLVPRHRCTVAPLHRCTVAPLHPCTLAPLHPCTIAPLPTQQADR